MSHINYFIVLAVGFAMSGFVSSFYQLVTSENADFHPFSKSVPAVLITVLLSMFAGPFIIARKIWSGMTNKEMRAPLAALLVVICSLWSFYSGVAVIYFTLPYVNQVQSLIAPSLAG